MTFALQTAAVTLVRSALAVDLAMTNALGRWVRAKTSGLAHLDLGERSATSPRAPGQHVIVTACRGHLDALADVVPDAYRPRCSNCQNIARKTSAA
jgi:hypothetical protein